MLFALFHMLRAIVRLAFACTFGTRLGIAVIVAVPVFVFSENYGFNAAALYFKAIVAADAAKIQEVQADAEKRIDAVQSEAAGKIATAQAQVAELQGKFTALETKLHPPPKPPEPRPRPLVLSPKAVNISPLGDLR